MNAHQEQPGPGESWVRRPKSALEQAVETHGPLEQPTEWVVHAACARPPQHSGVCTYRFADGMRWCFKCQLAWAE
jgi:hypothetical protein